MVEDLIVFWYMILGVVIAILVTGLQIVMAICVIWCVITIVGIIKELVAGCLDPQ